MVCAHRYNVARLSAAPLASRYPSLRRLALGAGEAKDVAALLATHLPYMRNLYCLDLWSYYSSISTALWDTIVRQSPPSLRVLRININESLLRRMEMVDVVAALEALQAARRAAAAGGGGGGGGELVVEFNTGHTFFGFRNTEAPTLQYLAGASYIRSVGFSVGLQGRALQGEGFMCMLASYGNGGAATAAAAATAGADTGGISGGGGGSSLAGMSAGPPSAAATTLEALSLTNYEAAERPPVAPLLHGLPLLANLRRLTLDCEISLAELWPLRDCARLTQLTVDMVVAPRLVRLAVQGAAQERADGQHGQGGGGPYDVGELGGALAVAAAGGGGAAAMPLPPGYAAPPVPVLAQVLELTVGSESHPTSYMSEAFPSLDKLTCESGTRKLSIYNVFGCGPMLHGASRLTSLTISHPLELQSASVLADAVQLTSLSYTHCDNASTVALLRAAVRLPYLRRLALWDHEEADEFLELRGMLRTQHWQQQQQHWQQQQQHWQQQQQQAQMQQQQPGSAEDQALFAALKEAGIWDQPGECGGAGGAGTAGAGGGVGGGGGGDQGGGGEPEPETDMRVVSEAQLEQLAARMVTRNSTITNSSSSSASHVHHPTAPASSHPSSHPAPPPLPGLLAHRQAPATALCFSSVTHLQLRATSPDFMSEVVGLVEDGALAFPAATHVHLDCCYDPPLLDYVLLGRALWALPALRGASVGGWATPGSEGVLLALGRRVGRPEVVMEYEYPFL